MRNKNDFLSNKNLMIVSVVAIVAIVVLFKLSTLGGSPSSDQIDMQAQALSEKTGISVDEAKNILGEATRSRVYREYDTCVFSNSKQLQKCYNSLGNSCTGTTSCRLLVRGNLNQKISWESTCGGYGSSVIDGKNEYINFECGSSEVKEQVKCVFYDATSPQKCYSDKGQSCEAALEACVCPQNSSSCQCPVPNTISCTVDVSGMKGDKLTWKSTCGGYAYTTIDGLSEYAEFKCGSSEVKEQVKCVFYDATSPQKCYSDKGQSCEASPPTCICNTNDITCQCPVPSTISCTVDVSGMKGDKLTWKSTCGGYAYTTIDGLSEYAEFKCGTIMSEQVKCVFMNSTTNQTCVSDKGSCSGVYSCTSYVSGINGVKLTWKSTCGGYAYTTIDGQTEYAYFACQQG